MRNAWVVLAFALAGAASAAPPSTCNQEGAYARSLCAYQKRDFAAAESGFRAIVDADAREKETLHAMYFLARTFMKTGRWQEAHDLFIRIYLLDKPFYDGWACDYLLGECRRALGKG